MTSCTSSPNAIPPPQSRGGGLPPQETCPLLQAECRPPDRLGQALPGLSLGKETLPGALGAGLSMEAWLGTRGGGRGRGLRRDVPASWVSIPAASADTPPGSWTPTLSGPPGKFLQG